MTRRKLKKLLRAEYGQRPDIHYFQGDMEHISDYYNFRRKNGMDEFLIDNVTWYDLDMDEVYRRINPGLTTSGEQYLYYMLRSPALDRDSFEFREKLISLMARESELRLNVQLILARLGRTRLADMCSAFYPRSHNPLLFFVYLLLCLAVPASALALAFVGARAIAPLIISITVTSLLHSFITRKIQTDLDTVNYSVGMVFTLRRLQKLRSPELDRLLAKAYDSLARLKAVLRSGGVTSSTDGGMGDLLCSVLLLDLVNYEFLKTKLGSRHEDVLNIHEALGALDAAIAIASYRASLGEAYCVPEIDFDAAKAAFRADKLCHPLIADCVPNDLDTERSVLLTGSNASGKSTFLKSAALCAIMAQSICTCTAGHYRASAFRVMSSMALRDDILSGESYYIVETRSLGRILNSIEGNVPVLCVVDEVLRGTNTVERIAASSKVLEAVDRSGALCLAATHDIELCSLLKDFTLFHFTETVGEEEMIFDYLLRPGPATSRNAINLLKLMGFGDGIVDGAHRRAENYLETGTWK